MTQNQATVALFGASGRLGRRIAAELLNRGHLVIGVIHANNPLPEHDRLELVRCDVHNQQQVAVIVALADVVMSALGSSAAPVEDVSSVGVANIISAMQTHGLQRIVTATGSAAREDSEMSAPHPWLHERHEMMSNVNPGLLRDGEEHLRLLNASRLDWTTVRAPRMTHGPTSGYQLMVEPPHPSAMLPYDSVAEAMIDLLRSKDWNRAAPFVG